MTIKFYWDSCMFYEWLCKETVHPRKMRAVLDILSSNKKKENIILTSVITHVECLPSKLDSKLMGAKDDYDALWDGIHFVDCQISANVLKLAREIKDYYYRPPVHFGKNVNGAKILDSGDAIHLATAIIMEADEFHSRDDARNGSKVPLVGLYDYSGKDKVCGRYQLKIVSPESAQGEMILDAPRP